MTTTEAEIERMRSEMQKLRAEIEQLGSKLGRTAKAGVREAGESVCKATKDFRKDIGRTAEQISDTIESNPVAAALGAFGVGMLLGRIFAARRN